jgi:hypothetical protein
MKFYADLYERLKAADNSTVSGNEGGNRVITLGEGLEQGFEDSVKRQKFVSQYLEPVITKLVRTTDLGTLRMATVSDRMAAKRNESTPFLNFLESNPEGNGVSLDYQYEFVEWNIGSDLAEVWNIEDDLPGEAKSKRPKRSNTITCVGNKLVMSDMVMDMARQQANIDMMAREVDLEVTRIRRKMNALLLSNSEVKFEASPNIPQLGGMITRSTLYGVDAGGGDLTRTLIQGRVNAIANDADPEGRGYGRPLIAFTNAKQLQVVRDIIISEYNGIYPTDRVAFEDMLRQRLRDFRVPANVFFEALPGPVIPFVLDSQLPSGTTIILESNEPRLVKMNLGGMPGPYVLTRPTEKLQRLDVCFDLFTLEDPLLESRSVISSVAV